jgi:hypothetical protein
VRLLTARRQPPPPPLPLLDEPATLVLDADAVAAGATEELAGRVREFAERHPGRRIRVTWQAEP